MTSDSVAEALSRGALQGARGNSGVILSQIIRGMTQRADGRRRANGLDLAQGLRLRLGGRLRRGPDARRGHHPDRHPRCGGGSRGSRRAPAARRGRARRRHRRGRQLRAAHAHAAARAGGCGRRRFRRPGPLSHPGGRPAGQARGRLPAGAATRRCGHGRHPGHGAAGGPGSWARWTTATRTATRPSTCWSPRRRASTSGSCDGPSRRWAIRWSSPATSALPGSTSTGSGPTRPSPPACASGASPRWPSATSTTRSRITRRSRRLRTARLPSSASRFRPLGPPPWPTRPRPRRSVLRSIRSRCTTWRPWPAWRLPSRSWPSPRPPAWRGPWSRWARASCTHRTARVPRSVRSRRASWPWGPGRSSSCPTTVTPCWPRGTPRR